MSNYKSKEFVPSDSSSDEDENVKPKVKTPEVSPVKEKKQKKEKKAKKNKEEVRFRSYAEPLRLKFGKTVLTGSVAKISTFITSSL